jgi:hypothetical protein
VRGLPYEARQGLCRKHHEPPARIGAAAARIIAATGTELRFASIGLDPVLDPAPAVRRGSRVCTRLEPPAHRLNWIAVREENALPPLVV